jgi:hypothetical protein
VFVLLQNDPLGQGLADDEPIGQNWPNEHKVGEVERATQYVPAAQTEMVPVLLQNDPAGQGLSVADPAGQNPPVLHAVEVSSLPKQYLPTGQATGEADPPAHVKPGRQKTQIVFDVTLQVLCLYWPAGHTLQMVQEVAP